MSTLYKAHDLINIKAYSENDSLHIFWWTQSTDDRFNPQRQPVWIVPYQDDNINRELVSYIIPLWKTWMNFACVRI